MPTHRKDLELGLPGVAAAVVVVFFFPILFLVARQRWRISKARKEEIGRLVVYASEEAARAENEHLKVYTSELEIAGGISFCDDGVSVGGGGDGVRRLCAMCYSPTTTRCSRCKSVRYCSGKCQIIHWRKGHKDECRPAVNIQSRTCNGLKSMSAAESKLPDDAWGNFVTKPAGECINNDALSDPFYTSCVSHNDDGIEIRNPVGSSPKTLDAVPTSANDVPFHSTKLDIRSSCEMSPPIEIATLITPVNNSCSGKLNHQTTGSSLNFNDGCGDLFKMKVSKKAIAPHLDSKPFFSFIDTFPSRSNSRIRLSDSEGNGGFLLKPKASKSPSNVSSATGAHVSRGNHVSGCTPLTVSTPIKPLGNTNFSSNGGHALKSSVQRVEQLKSSKTSKLSKSYKALPSYDAYLKLYSERGELQPYGLINCGNSCYANAVLQCLTFTRPLTAYFLQRLHSNSCPKREWCFTCELESLVVMAKQGKSPLSPIGILSQIHNLGSSLGHGKEEDAHEFLRCAIDAMQQDCIRERGKQIGIHSDETTLMQQIFGGYLRSKIRCMRCQGTSQRDEIMMDLTVEIGPGDNKTLEQALARFTTHEILDGENKYKCNRCKSYEKARKRLTIFEAPNVLTIALKRFQSGKYGKLNKTVQFPEILNISDYMSSGSPDKSPLYCLYAVIVHVDIMNAAFSGHYVCYVKNTQGKWYKVDDSTVKPVELERVLSEGAYMLLYARVSPHIPKPRKYPEGECVTYEKSAANFRPSPDHHTVNSMGSFYVNSHSGRFSPRYGFYKPDASSESSSMSFSDESSVSTESTRDSNSTDEYHSDYFLAENWYSPSRLSEESDGSPLPDFLGNSKSASNLRSLGNRNSCFLYSEKTTKHSRKLTEQFNRSCSGNGNSSRSRESEWDNKSFSSSRDG